MDAIKNPYNEMLYWVIPNILKGISGQFRLTEKAKKKKKFKFSAILSDIWVQSCSVEWPDKRDTQDEST